jgi:hypothetical protein
VTVTCHKIGDRRDDDPDMASTAPVEAVDVVTPSSEALILSDAPVLHGSTRSERQDMDVHGVV